METKNSDDLIVVFSSLILMFLSREEATNKTRKRKIFLVANIFLFWSDERCDFVTLLSPGREWRVEVDLPGHWTVNEPNISIYLW